MAAMLIPLASEVIMAIEVDPDGEGEPGLDVEVFKTVQLIEEVQQIVIEVRTS